MTYIVENVIIPMFLNILIVSDDLYCLHIHLTCLISFEMSLR